MGLPPSKQVIFKDLASGWERWEFRFGWELLRSWEGGGGRGEGGGELPKENSLLPTHLRSPGELLGSF